MSNQIGLVTPTIGGLAFLIADVSQTMPEGQATSDKRQLNRTVWAAHPQGSGPFLFVG